jgi:hypothetical protein
MQAWRWSQRLRSASRRIVDFAVQIASPWVNTCGAKVSRCGPHGPVDNCGKTTGWGQHGWLLRVSALAQRLTIARRPAESCRGVKS